MITEEGIEIFEYLHDGIIIAINGTLPGLITFEISCNYLRERFLEEGKTFLVKLFDCTQIRYESNIPGESTTYDLEKISSFGCDILSARNENSELVIYTGPGQLIINCGYVSIYTNNDTQITFQQLAKESDAYWEIFSSQKKK